jgi:putative GTP pyrophosphokinase
MYQARNLERICKNVVASIDDELSRVGIFFRIFSRVKSSDSTEIKINSKGINYYDGINKSLRDTIGIRVVFYFSDDVPIAYFRLKKFFEFVEETIDNHDETKFAPTKINLVFRLKSDLKKEFVEVVHNPIIDSTYEVQLRTILSEGWHEVEHDLRYKCLDDWKINMDLSRNLNGILASLETSEYAMLRLFDQLSYRHYKSKDYIAMLRTKFRLRFVNYEISEELIKYLNNGLMREIFKIDRLKVINFLFESNILTPITMEALIFIVNYKFIKDENIIAITPDELINELE